MLASGKSGELLEFLLLFASSVVIIIVHVNSRVQALTLCPFFTHAIHKRLEAGFPVKRRYRSRMLRFLLTYCCFCRFLFQMLSEGERTFHIRSDLLKTFLARNFQTIVRLAKGRGREWYDKYVAKERTDGTSLYCSVICMMQQYCLRSVLLGYTCLCRMCFYSCSQFVYCLDSMIFIPPVGCLQLKLVGVLES